MLARLWMRLRALLFRRRLARDMHEEIEDHLARVVARLKREGLSDAEARRAALHEFGHVPSLVEAARDARGGYGIDSIVADLRFGLRHMAQTPFSTVVMILMFALGIGANTALFAVIRGFVAGPVPAVALDDARVRIRGIDQRAPGRAIGREFSYPEFREHAAQSQLYRDVAAWTSTDVVIDVGSGAEQLVSGAATFVTANYFQVLDLRIDLGAGLPPNRADDDAVAAPVAVISHVIWERHFDRAPDVAGRTIKINGVAATIAGVAPRRFAGARTGGSQVRVWLPLAARPAVLRTAAPLPRDDEDILGLIARLQPHVTAADATPTAAAIAARHGAAPAGPRGGNSADVVRMLGNNYFPPAGAPDERPLAAIVATLIFPLLVLSITCTSVSALLAGLAVRRRREISVRLALGAGRRRIIRQLLTESVLLSVAGGAVGLFVVWLLLRLFDASIPDLDIRLDTRVWLFTTAVATAAGILFGVSPALHATRIALSDVLKSAADGVVGGRLRLQSLLVVAQIALTQPALLGLGAVFLELNGDLRERPRQPFADQLVELRYNTNPRYGVLDARREAAIARVQERIAALPGVAGVARTTERDDFISVDVHPDDRRGGAGVPVSLLLQEQPADLGYFAMMRLPVVHGRDFDPGERGREGALIVGSTLTRRLWDSADPIGRRFVSTEQGPRLGRVFTVVGVVDDDVGGPVTNDRARVFVPRIATTGRLLIRTHAAAEPMVAAVRSAAHAAAPELPAVGTVTLATVEAAERRSVVRMVYAAGGASVVALLLSAIGLYTVVAFAVGQRAREIGIRAALGASNRQVVGLFLKRGMLFAAAGLAIGSVMSAIFLRVMAAAMGDEPPTGLLALTAVVAVVVLGVALIATWLPARRALRVDPIDVLRAE